MRPDGQPRIEPVVRKVRRSAARRLDVAACHRFIPPLRLADQHRPVAGEAKYVDLDCLVAPPAANDGVGREPALGDKTDRVIAGELFEGGADVPVQAGPLALQHRVPCRSGSHSCVRPGSGGTHNAMPGSSEETLCRCGNEVVQKRNVRAVIAERR